MRKEIENWWRQAAYDLDTARDNFGIGRYSTAAFLCQQAAEKALKALFLFENRGMVPQSHSLIYLANNTSTPKGFMGFLRDLTPKFVNTRYPDAASELPYLLYEKDNTEPIIKKTDKLLGWIGKRMKLE